MHPSLACRIRCYQASTTGTLINYYKKKKPKPDGLSSSPVFPTLHFADETAAVVGSKVASLQE